MPPFYRIVEVAVYALLNFLPFLVLALLPFKNRLRFSMPITIGLICAVSLVQIGLGMWATFSDDPNGIVSIFSTVIYFVFYVITVKAHIGKKLFSLLMLSNIANFIVILAKYLEHLCFPALSLEAYRWSHSLFLAIVEILLLIPMAFPMRKQFRSAMQNENIKVAWRYLFLIPATFYFIWFYHLYAHTHSSETFAFEFSNVFFLLVMNLGSYLIYYMVSILVLEQTKNITLEEHNHMLAMQTLQYENLQERIKEARHAKHDIRHHISVMLSYIEEENYEKLKEYLKSYRRSVPDDSSMELCANHAVNVLLLYFGQQAKTNDIDYVVKTDLPKDIHIADNDISVLLGNLLENALEACIHQTNTDDKKIIIGASHDGNSVYFTIDNTYDNEIRKDKNGVYLTTKKTGNGLGLESVKNITASYDGIFTTEQQNGMFYASVMLKMKSNISP